MPYCETGNGIKIFYRTYGQGPIKVLLIIGLAGTHESWSPQISGLLENNDSGIEICAFDNRGMGRSSVPINKSEYTTKIMANDAIALLDHLGWEKAHVFGHSMGGMIACKLAAMVPNRILSLALLNVTGGGMECFPRLDGQTISIAFRFMRAQTPEQRAAVDLDTHYTKEYLEEYVGSQTRREILHQQYVKAISSAGMQSSYGFEGQTNACLMHTMTNKEIESIRSAGFLVTVIHGRHDVVAQINYARRLADKLQPMAKMVDLHGGHLVSHERTEEVNEALHDLIFASEMKISPQEWTNVSKNNSVPAAMNMSIVKTYIHKETVSLVNGMLERLNISVWYCFRSFVMAVESVKTVIRRVKPVKVVPSITYPSAAEPCLIKQ